MIFTYNVLSILEDDTDYPMQVLDDALSAAPSPSSQVERPRFSSPTLVHHTSSTRNVPIPMRDGSAIPHAQSFPLRSGPTLGKIKIPPKRRSARIRTKAEIAEAARVATPSPPPSADPPGNLGLYDDSDDCDDIRRDENGLLADNTDSGEETMPVDKTSSNSSHSSEDSEKWFPSYAPPVKTSYDPPTSPDTVYTSSHSNWIVRVILTLVALLHTKHHLSFRACTLLLSVLSLLLLSLGVIQLTEPMPTTLHTVIKRLDLGDRFTIFPICSTCHRIFEPNVNVNILCPDCDTAIFKPLSATLFERITGRKAHRPPPVAAAPIQVLSSLLADFLSSPEIETSCSEWKTRKETPGELHDMPDGRIWKNLRGHDGEPFFNKTDQSSELRLGVTLSLDW